MSFIIWLCVHGGMDHHDSGFSTNTAILSHMYTHTHHIHINTHACARTTDTLQRYLPDILGVYMCMIFSTKDVREIPLKLL